MTYKASHIEVYNINHTLDIGNLISINNLTAIDISTVTGTEQIRTAMVTT